MAVYIDGGNTYQRLKEVGIPEKSTRFDFSVFVKHLVGERELISKRYYVGVVKNFDGSAKGEQMVNGGAIREKGVDVKLAVDLVIGAADNIYDTAIVVSSDTDLIPAIKYVRKAKDKTVEHVGFGANPSLGMIKESLVSRLFSKTDLVQFQKIKSDSAS